jgi:hypothetical protein
LFWLAVGGTSVLAARPDQQCIDSFRKKEFVSAADCFEKLSAKTPLTEKDKKGRWLRNAAVSFNNAAKAVGKSTKKDTVAQAAYYRERAVLLFDRYLTQKLCRSPRRCKSAAKLRALIERSIGYASISIVVNDKKAAYTVTGYEFLKQGTGNKPLNLRPGDYTVSVKYPGSSKLLKRSIKVYKGKGQILTFQNPTRKKVVVKPPKPAPPSVSWMVLGLAGGGGLLVVGGGLLIGGLVVWQWASDAWLDPKITAEDSLSSKVLGEALIVVGSVLAAGGAALMVVGPMLHNKKPSARSKKTKKTALLYNSAARSKVVLSIPSIRLHLP